MFILEALHRKLKAVIEQYGAHRPRQELDAALEELLLLLDNPLTLKVTDSMLNPRPLRILQEMEVITLADIPEKWQKITQHRQFTKGIERELGKLKQEIDIFSPVG